MKQIRVLVVDDSAFMRKMLTNILTSDQRINVVGTARNGEDGLKKVAALSPDVITLDIEMPVMDGLTMLEKITEKYRLPTVMLSSISKRAPEKVVQAMAMGAVGFIEKPSGQISLDIEKIKDKIVNTVVEASQAKVSKPSQVTKQLKKRPQSRKQTNSIITIGTSTGGPRALQQVLQDIDPNITAPIFIVQHMPPRFTTSLAKRLDSLVSFHVKEATHNEVVQASTVYIAPGDFHMEVHKERTNLVIKLTKSKSLHGHRPAVDVLLNSVARIRDNHKISAVLTGMGRDGAEGTKNLKLTNPESVTIAEAKESAIIFGMPEAAIQTNCIDQVVHLSNIGETISNLVR